MFGRHGFRLGPGGPRFMGKAMRMRRGDMKFLLLEVLKEGPRHGYDIISELERQSGYRPSPGSVYPTLTMLEEGGYLTSEQVEGKKVYTITASGRQLLDGRGPQDAEPERPFDHVMEVKESAFKLAHAVMQAVRTGDSRTTTQLKAILD